MERELSWRDSTSVRGRTWKLITEKQEVSVYFCTVKQFSFRIYCTLTPVLFRHTHGSAHAACEIEKVVNTHWSPITGQKCVFNIYKCWNALWDAKSQLRAACLPDATAEVQLARPLCTDPAIACPSLGLTHQQWLLKHCSALYNPSLSHTGRNPGSSEGFSPRAFSWQSVTEGRDKTNQPINYKVHDSSRQLKRVPGLPFSSDEVSYKTSRKRHDVSNKTLLPHCSITLSKDTSYSPAMELAGMRIWLEEAATDRNSWQGEWG